LRATGSPIVLCSSRACDGSPLRASAIAPLTAAISGEGVDAVAATASDASGGLGRGIVPVVFAFAAEDLSLLAGALAFAAAALSFGAAALSFGAAALAFGAAALAFGAAALSFGAGLVACSSFGAPPAEPACRAMPRAPAIASAVK